METRVKVGLAVWLISIISLVPFLMSGCNGTTNSTDTTPQITQPALPLLDTEVHDSVETAYFALG